MIGVEWTYNQLRAWRLAPDGAVRDRRISQRGLAAVPDTRFSDMLREELGRWVAGGEDCVLICGPAAGARGWRTPRPAPCPVPCGPSELAAALVDVPFDWARVKLVPGVADDDGPAGRSETRNGEETWLIGAAAAIGGTGRFCLPGPVCCWSAHDTGRITALSTYLTGETFSVLRTALFGRPPRDAALDPACFDRGVDQGARPGGLLRALAELQAEAALPDAAPADLAATLFGLLVGKEVRAALAPRAEVHLVGATELAQPYARAIDRLGGAALPPLGDTTVAGLAAIGALAHWR